MYYYKKQNKEIIKYKVNLDEETLKKLRLEIILKCSTITHHHYKTTHTPNWFDWEHIQNYSEIKIGVIEYNDFYSMPETEYLVDYNYYEHPPLVDYIDKLLKCNTSMIGKIKTMSLQNVDEEELILKEQQELIKKLNELGTKDISEQLELLKENQKKLLEYKKQKELNKNQVSPNKYRNKVLNCINLEEIERISLKTVLEVQKFFMSGSHLTIEDSLNKVLKLNKEAI